MLCDSFEVGFHRTGDLFTRKLLVVITERSASWLRKWDMGFLRTGFSPVLFIKSLFPDLLILTSQLAHRRKVGIKDLTAYLKLEK